MICRVGFFVAASLAAFAVSQITTNCSRKGYSRLKNSGSSLQQEQIEEQEHDNLEDSIVSVEPKQEEDKEEEVQRHFKKLNNVIEIELLKNLVQELEQRRLTLEMKILELYGLKQKKLSIAQLQKLLTSKNREINMLNLTLHELQFEKENLHEEVKQNQLTEKQLEIAKRRILEIQTKMNTDAVKLKGQLMVLKEQVLGLNMEDSSMRDDKVEKNHRGTENVQLEAVEMRRCNKYLQLEIRELTVKLVAAQNRITVLSKMTQSNIIAELEEGMSSLRHSNEDLLKQVERLQHNRFRTVEELVYQRWLNACLRFEIKYPHTLQNTPKRGLRKKLSFESEDKSKHLMPLSDTNFGSMSSDSDETSTTTTTATTTSTSYSSGQTMSKKSSLMHKIKRWGRSKDDSSARSCTMIKRGLVRRFSTSAVPSYTSALKKKGDLTPNCPRVRRVSFSDSVKSETSIFQDHMMESAKGVSDKEQTIAGRFEDGFVTSAMSKSSAEMKEKEPEAPPERLSFIPNKLSKSGIDITEDLIPGMPNLAQCASKMGDQRVQLIATVVLVFLIILLAVYISRR